MNTDPTFVITIGPRAMGRLKRTTNRLNVTAGGSDDLWMELESQGITSDDVVLITLENESGENRAICDAVRSIESTGLDVHVYLNVHPSADPAREAYLIASVMDGGLVEFQVSDGPAGHRGTSYDTYDIEEARRIFDEVVEKGWRSACRS